MITAPDDIREALPARIARTLAADRYFDFANCPSDDGWRTRCVSRIESGVTEIQPRLASWHGQSGFVPALLREWSTEAGTERCHVLKAKLVSRLLVNLGGTALENGGLSLDRISGVPFVPGSAVKGVARREAIARLKAASPEAKLALFINIAFAFGWGPDDWSDRTNRSGVPLSDFAWACASSWPSIQAAAKEQLRRKLQLEELPSAFRGWICFLPAFPDCDPGIEADVVTCHHREYYSNERSVATDDENPVPVVFPTIPPNGCWTFPLLAESKSPADLLTNVREFLAAGLRAGLGAKTNAGYGRFQPLEPNHEALPVEQSEEFAFIFVTPCMCAGARQEKAELRISSLRGSLRWWFRALGGTPVEEQEVFGGVSGSAHSSGVSIELKSVQRGPADWQNAGLQDKQGRSVRLLQRPNDPGSYIWHFAAVAQNEKRLWSQDRRSGRPNEAGALPPGTNFVLVRRFHRTLSPSAQKKFDDTWEVFSAVGAVGLRAARAMGCWTPNGQTDLNRVFQILRTAGFAVNMGDQQFATWQKALFFIEKWLHYWLRRKDMYPVGGDAEGKNQNLTPLGSANPRQGSAVQFRVFKSADGKFVPLAFEAPGDRILTQKARRKQPVLTGEILKGQAPQPPKHGTRRPY